MNEKLNAAWPMLFVTILTTGFFAGGVFLEFEAADHGLAKIHEHFGTNPEALRAAIAFQTDRIARIHAMAAAAVDLAKIGLGALVVLATQAIPLKSVSQPAKASES